MNLNLKDKVAIVTGSTKGIGLSIAQTLCHEGCKVVINGRDPKGVDLALTTIPGAIGVAGDACKLDVIQKIQNKAMNEFGGFDILICAVGSGRSVPPGQEDAQEWQRIFELNFWGAVNFIESARDALEKSKGTIVCISSICGLEVVPNAPITYSVAKAALHAYVRGISRPLGKSGVRINAIAPGNILGNDSVWSRKIQEDQSGVLNYIEQNVSLGRFGRDCDVANLTAYLASSVSNFATGSIWTLDGGQIRS